MIILGSRTGTHVDAKIHVVAEGEGADKLPLERLYGKCKVFDPTHVSREIHRKDMKNYPVKKGDIILLKTKKSKIAYKKFRKGFVHLKFDAAEYLVESGVKTLGFDYLSVKKFGGDPEVHDLLIGNLTLFEGLNLANICAGE